MTIYLYVKTHNKTGLKYLGKTKSKDPHKYQGSGDIWKEHIKEYGYDVTTEILQECQTSSELSKWGRYYSSLWDIVNDSKWANKIPETGGGHYSGFSENRLKSVTKSLKGVPKTEEHKLKLRGKRGKQKHPKKSGANMSRVIRDHQKTAISLSLKNIPKTENHKKKIAESMSIKCSCLCCNKEIAACMLSRHYKKHPVDH